MAISDARIARGIATRLKVAIPTIVQNFFNIHALLMIAKKRGNIKWRGSGTDFIWHVRKTKAASTFGGGELGVRTFEEIDPAFKAQLPYCWLEETYGVSDKTIESNRHAGGEMKIYDSLKENLSVAEIALHQAFGPAVYNGSTVGSDDPVGLLAAIGDAIESSSKVLVGAGQTFGGVTLNTSAISAYVAGRTSWDTIQYAPEVISIHEVPGFSSAKWSTHCIKSLAYVAEQMSATRTNSGTGRPIKPDTAFMSDDPFTALKNKLIDASLLHSIPVGNEALKLAGWVNIQVDTLLTFRDTNVPADTGSKERVFIVAADEFFIETTHTKAEGLVKHEKDMDSVVVSGAIGVLKANMAYRINPTGVGCILGCDD